MKCPRCGERFTPTRIHQTRCGRCEIETATLIELDERRRVVRFQRARDMTGAAA